jgi:hypothetical protein
MQIDIDNEKQSIHESNKEEKCVVKHYTGRVPACGSFWGGFQYTQENKIRAREQMVMGSSGKSEKKIADPGQGKKYNVSLSMTYLPLL